MPVNSAIKLLHVLDISGFALFTGSLALNAYEDALNTQIPHLPNILQSIASFFGMIWIVVRLYHALLDAEAKRIKNKSDKLDLEKKEIDHEKPEQQ